MTWELQAVLTVAQAPRRWSTRPFLLAEVPDVSRDTLNAALRRMGPSIVSRLGITPTWRASFLYSEPITNFRNDSPGSIATRTAFVAAEDARIAIDWWPCWAMYDESDTRVQWRFGYSQRTYAELTSGASLRIAPSLFNLRDDWREIAREMRQGGGTFNATLGSDDRAFRESLSRAVASMSTHLPTALGDMLRRSDASVVQERDRAMRIPLAVEPGRAFFVSPDDWRSAPFDFSGRIVGFDRSTQADRTERVQRVETTRLGDAVESYVEFPVEGRWDTGGDE